ncbi:MAG: hypothetical protein WCT31_03805 [Candidatus Micrarchaeia archaeon]|jgi:hypothetical protein
MGAIGAWLSKHDLFQRKVAKLAVQELLPQDQLPLRFGPVRVDNLLFVSSDKTSIATMGTDHMRIMLSRSKGDRLVPRNIRFAETAEEAIGMARKTDLAIVQFSSHAATQELINNMLSKNPNLKIVVFAPGLDFLSNHGSRDQICSLGHITTNTLEPEILQDMIRNFEHGPENVFRLATSPN